MKVTTRTVEDENTINKDDNQQKENFADKLDVIRFVADIKLRLKKDISADFVLAKLGDKDKEAIIEMTTNAYFSKKLLTILANRSKKWTWKEDKYVREYIPEEECNYIKALANAVFDSYMTRIYMTVILNRNVDGNYIVNVLSAYKSEAEKDDLDITPDEARKQLANLMKNEEKTGGKEK